jgi:hypothetical protein
VLAEEVAMKNVIIVVAQIGCVVVAFSVIREGLMGVSIQRVPQRWVGYPRELLCLENDLIILDAIHCSHVVDVISGFCAFS